MDDDADADTTRRWPRWLVRPPLVVALLLALVIVGLRWSEVDALGDEGRDLLQDHLSAGLLVDEDSAAVYEPFTVDQVREAGGQPGITSPQSVHPVTVLALFAPLSSMEFAEAAVWWSILTVAFFGLAWWALTRELEVGWLVWFTPALAWWFPLELHLRFGQWSTLLFALTVGAWIGLRRRRDRLAGLAIGAAILVKVFPAALLVVPLVRRRGRAVWWALGSTAVGLVLAYAWRPTASRSFVTDVVPTNADRSLDAFGNSSLRSFVTKAFEGGQFVDPVVDASSVVTAVVVVATIVVVVAVGYVLWASDDLDIQMSTVVVAMLLLSPVTWVHAWVLLLLPAVVLGTRVTVRRSPLLVACLLVTAGLTQVDHWRLGQDLTERHADVPAGAWMHLAAPGIAVLLSLLVVLGVVAHRERRGAPGDDAANGETSQVAMPVTATSAPV